MKMKRFILLFGSAVMAQFVATGCMAGTQATATADEQKAYETRHAELPKNFSMKPGKYGAFVGESKAISIGGIKPPSKPAEADTASKGAGN
jgi:hypothetical protein